MLTRHCYSRIYIYTVVIISQYIQRLNHYVVHLKLVLYANNISIKERIKNRMCFEKVKCYDGELHLKNPLNI